MIGLRYIRLLLGIKGEDFVKPLESNKSTLSLWETQKRKIPLDIKEDISKRYGVPIVYIDKALNDDDREYLKTLIGNDAEKIVKADTENEIVNKKMMKTLKKKIENPDFYECFKLAEQLSAYPNKDEVCKLLKAIELFLKNCN